MMTKNFTKLSALFVATSIFFASCKKEEAIPQVFETFTNVNANSSQEVPTNTSSATSTSTLKYEKNSNVLTYTINYTGLTPTAMHFHKGVIGTSGAVQIEVKAPYTSGMTGTLTLTDAQETDLLAGLWYLNIHSATYAGGEIRGQVVAENFAVISNVVATSKEETSVASLNSSSSASATLNGLFNKTTKRFTYALTITGLTPTVLNLHKGEVGVSGPVNIALLATGGTTDAFTAQQETDLFAGSLYLNIMSSSRPLGEVRGQITANNQLVFATTANGQTQGSVATSTARAAIYTVYNKTTKSLTYTINFINVTPTFIRFHKGTGVAVGEVSQNIAGPYTTGMRASVTLTTAQEVDLFANQWYFNLVSQASPNGEIRGQLGR